MDIETTNLLNSLLILAFPASIIIAVIASIFNKITNDKTQSLKYITDERAKWREFVKTSVSMICSRNYGKEDKKAVITKLKLSLNPLGGEGNKLDEKILELLNQILLKEPTSDVLDELSKYVGLLLKHDWERSKSETRSIFTKWYYNCKLKKMIKEIEERISINESCIT